MARGQPLGLWEVLRPLLPGILRITLQKSIVAAAVAREARGTLRRNPHGWEGGGPWDDFPHIDLPETCRRIHRRLRLGRLRAPPLPLTSPRALLPALRLPRHLNSTGGPPTYSEGIPRRLFLRT